MSSQHASFPNDRSAHRPSLRQLAVLVISGALLTFSAIGLASNMFNIFKADTVHLCPDVVGSLKLNGTPVSGVRIVRGLDFADNYQEDEVITDEEGKFSFPKIENEVRNANSFGTASIMQVITAHVDDKEVLLWTTVAPNIIPHKTITEKLSNLHCDLKNPEQGLSFPNQESSDGATHEVLTICRW
ncbi:DUF6795 domain-containing protein [Aurantivibrio plasticivorans]